METAQQMLDVKEMSRERAAVAAERHIQVCEFGLSYFIPDYLQDYLLCQF